MAVWTLAAPAMLFGVNFNAARAYSFGDNNAGYSLVAQDFNGDGLPDVAVAVSGYSSASVQIFLANGNGNLALANTYSLPSGLGQGVSVVSGDFNRDGKLDLAVLTINGISILLGQGDGSFAAGAFYAASGYSIVTADFNGDGIPDLATANSVANNVSILLGVGDGTFLPAVAYGVGLQPQFLVAGDFNGDGKLDLAVTNEGTASPGTVSILFGVGDGTFHKAVNHAVGDRPQSIAVGDFNGDGKPDLAITKAAGGVAILLAAGNGTFLPPVVFDAGPNPGAVTVLRKGRHGNLDLAVVNLASLQGPGGHTVSILKGNGDGTFQVPVPYYVVEFPLSIAFADFNGDGQPDLAVASAGYTGALSILPGNGHGGFEQFASQNAGGNSTFLVAGDFNGDGKLDLVVSGSGIAVMLGNGDGTFRAPSTVATQDGGQLVAADFNADGKLDLAVASSFGVLIFLGNGDGTFQAPVSLGAPAGFIALANITGDGRASLIDVYSSEVYALIGNGDGTFQVVNSEPIDTPFTYDIAMGDFNGDGKTDFAVEVQIPGEYTYYGSEIYLGNGDGTFDYAGATYTGLSEMVAADFNGDGKVDLAGTYGDVYVTLGQGNGVFGNAAAFQAGGQAYSLAAGDFNGDGKVDLVANGNGIVSVLLGNGDGTFQPQKDFIVGARPADIAVGDFNGDGKADLAVADNCTNDITILTNLTK